MKPLSGREFARAVERRGWRLLRVSGSHHIYGKPGETARLSILIHGTNPLKSGLQRHLMKLAGLSEADVQIPHQHKEKKPSDPTIREKFDTYRFADHKERVVDLLGRVTRVSVETVAITEAMRAAKR